MGTEYFVVFPIIILFTGAYMAPVLYRLHKRTLYPVSVGSLVLAFAFILRNIIFTSDGSQKIYTIGGWEAPWGIELVTDPLSAYLSGIICVVALLVIIGSRRQVEAEIPNENIRWFYAAALLAIGASIGMVSTRDLFNLFVFIEISAISGCALVSIKGSASSMEATFKYLLLTSIGSSFILLSIAYLYMSSGNLNMIYVGSELGKLGDEKSGLILIALALFTVGMLIKAAQFPLHVWLPDAYWSAPSPSTALLSGILSKAYIGAIIRVYSTVFTEHQALNYVHGLLRLLGMAAAVGIIVISIILLRQINFKRLLAYSSVAHTGYIFLGLALSSMGVIGGLFHILNHAVIQSALFLTVGRIGHYEENSFSNIKGLFRRDRIAGALIIAGSLSMIGIPFFNGFVSKWNLFLGTIEFGAFIPYGIVLVVSTIMSAVYYGRIASRCLEEGDTKLPVNNMGESIVLVVFILIIIGLGLYPAPILNYLRESGLYNILN